ncbi:hypothetical protein HK100_000649 [Physocladia obscura]|uniref:Uncharacterized protein n=1 Tax=Physocladia obscura TaxID=109957 RepID=A0AAD5XKC5_9FUNG|nr:hypothetical protein HK100_000649 [Physocladia obscura]
MGGIYSKFGKSMRRINTTTINNYTEPGTAAALGSAQSTDGIVATWNPNNPSTSNQDQREYHAVESSDYVLPSGAVEQNRLRFQNIMLFHAFRRHAVDFQANK